MLALLCDTCKRPIEDEGFEITLMPGAVVNGPNELARFSVSSSGILSAAMCRRCGERISAILHHKLMDPCAVCEVAPLAVADRRVDESPPRRHAGAA